MSVIHADYLHADYSSMQHVKMIVMLFARQSSVLIISA
uniref:Uncharacterized protein n=1 Tax=Anguilla anguilla TaxID=7936 RepID=A0A0E9SDX0_ANGAN